jgi:hypothetical protein
MDLDHSYHPRVASLTLLAVSAYECIVNEEAGCHRKVAQIPHDWLAPLGFLHILARQLDGFYTASVPDGRTFAHVPHQATTFPAYRLVCSGQQTHITSHGRNDACYGLCSKERGIRGG